MSNVRSSSICSLADKGYSIPTIAFLVGTNEEFVKTVLAENNNGSPLPTEEPDVEG